MVGLERRRTVADLAIRPARPDDVPAIRPVTRASWRAAYDDLPPEDELRSRWERWYDSEALEQQISHPDGIFLVTERDGRLVGIAHAVPGWDPPELARLYVDPDVWGEGIGSRLLEETLEAVSEEGIPRIVLRVHRGNDRAVAFYRARGFDRVPDLDDEEETAFKREIEP